MNGGQELPNTPDGGRECNRLHCPSLTQRSEGSETGDDIFAVNEGAFWRLAGRTVGKGATAFL
jgi:hypothetical protein